MHGHADRGLLSEISGLPGNCNRDRSGGGFARGGQGQCARAGCRVMATVPLLPRPILRLAGVADKLKFGAPTTVRESVVEVLTLPLTPLMVTVKVPMAALVLAVKVKVLVLVVLAGLNDAVTPPGTPEAERPTAPLNPLSGVTVMVLPT